MTIRSSMRVQPESHLAIWRFGDLVFCTAGVTAVPERTHHDDRALIRKSPAGRSPSHQIPRPSNSRIGHQSLYCVPSSAVPSDSEKTSYTFPPPQEVVSGSSW